MHIHIIHTPYIYSDTHVHILTSYIYIHTYTCMPNVFSLQFISFFLCFYSLGCFYFPLFSPPPVPATPLRLSPALLYSYALLSSTWRRFSLPWILCQWSHRLTDWDPWEGGGLQNMCSQDSDHIWFFNKINFLLPFLPSDGRTVREQCARRLCRDMPSWCPSLQTSSLALLLA